MQNPQKYDSFKEDYDETGRPVFSERLKSEQDEEKERRKEAAQINKGKQNV